MYFDYFYLYVTSYGPQGQGYSFRRVGIQPVAGVRNLRLNSLFTFIVEQVYYGAVQEHTSTRRSQIRIRPIATWKILKMDHPRNHRSFQLILIANKEIDIERFCNDTALPENVYPAMEEPQEAEDSTARSNGITRQ